MPPAAAADLAYSWVRNERHTPVAWLPPNGPSPSVLVIIWENIELRNIASKSCAAARAFALVIAPAARVMAAGVGPKASVAHGGGGPMPGGLAAAAIPSPRFPLWRGAPPSFPC